MAQNINIIQYPLMPAGAPQPAPAGQTYQLPANSLIGEMSCRRRDNRKINDHKRSMGLGTAKGDPVYGAWRDAVKDQLLARGYLTDIHHFPDAEFHQIVAGFRRLRPTCDKLATASAANNIPSMQAADEVVIQLVKDCAKKLTDTIKLPNKPFPQVPGVPPAQVIVPNLLLPANAPPQTQCGVATMAQIVAAGVLNALPANAPVPAQVQPPAQPGGAIHNNPPPHNPQGPIQPALPASGNAGESGSAAQNMPPPGIVPIKFRLRSSGAGIKMGGGPPANNPPQVMPQVVLLNQSAQNLPQQAVGAIQNNPPPL